MGKRKGQEMVFELVLIFSIGVIIVTILYSSFNSYERYYSSMGTGDSLNKIKQMVSLSIIQLAEKGADSRITLKIPPRVVNDVYLIELSQFGLNVSSKNVFRSSTLYGLDSTYSFSGRVPSINGRITIYKSGNQIIIE